MTAALEFVGTLLLALGGADMRPKYAPSADLLERKAAAAERSACAARLATRLVLPLIILSAVILVPGQRPNQLAQCPTVGRRDISAPVSEITASGGDAQPAWMASSQGLTETSTGSIRPTPWSRPGKTAATPSS